tara:strand:+ start:600 stop:1799 length:1200 start_codon:yes stop_codon:yes gene_type:complete
MTKNHKTTFTLKQQKKIISLNSKHLPLLKICSELNISYGRLHSFLKSKKLLHGRRKRDDLPKNKIVNDYLSGLTVVKLGKKYKCNAKTIRKILSDNSVKMINSSDRLTHKIEKINNIYKDIIQRKITIGQKAKELKVSKYILKQRLLDEGKILRSKAEEQKIYNLSRYPDFNYNFFKKRNKFSNYWAGFIAADGSIRGTLGKKLQLQIQLSSLDLTHLENLKNLLNHGSISVVDRSNYSPIYAGKVIRSKNAAVFSLSSTALCEDLVDIGITPKKTHTLEINQKLLFSKDFWRGMIDGDGSISKLKNKLGNIATRVSFGTGSLNTSEGFIKFLNRNNIKGIEKKLVKKKLKSEKDFYSITLTGKKARKLVNILYVNAPYEARLDRKYKRAKEWFNYNSN